MGGGAGPRARNGTRAGDGEGESERKIRQEGGWPKQTTLVERNRCRAEETRRRRHRDVTTAAHTPRIVPHIAITIIITGIAYAPPAQIRHFSTPSPSRRLESPNRSPTIPAPIQRGGYAQRARTR